MGGATGAQSAKARHRRIRGKRVLEDEGDSMQKRSKRLPTDGSICNQCSRLDLLGALQKATRIREREIIVLGSELYHGIRIAHVGHYFRKPRSTACALCSILFASRVCPDQPSTASDDGDEIRLITFLEYSRLVNQPLCFSKYDSAFLAVVPSQFGSHAIRDSQTLRNHVGKEGAAMLLREGDRPAMFSAQEVPDVFDAIKVNTWMQYCKSNHSTLCGSSKSALVPGLRLIDCENLCVTEVKSNEPYVALSYVWGKLCDVNSTIRRTRNRLILPARLTTVISDAISVTKALGFQYLWVDRFCIDQDNPGQKHQQINQMHAIYENADLAIVAAAGADETYGLPGVGHTARTRQCTAKFNGVHVIPTMTDPHFSIRSSRWASRGWTFQEAALSRRRLVFTDQQLYFECNTMNCFESIHSPLDTIHQNDKAKSPNGSRSGILSRFTPGMRPSNREGFWQPVEYGRINFDTLNAYLISIEEYSSRRLGYDSDSLNAFQGIIQRFSKLERPLHAIWGMPYLAKEDARRQSFCYALCWSHSQSFSGDSKGPRRRPEFPSWTWAGWEGAIRTVSEPLIQYYNHRIEAIRFADLGNENEEDLDSFDCTTWETGRRVLRLLAISLRPSVSWKPLEEGNIRWSIAGFSSTLFPSEKCMLGESFVQELMDVEKWRCLWVVTHSKHSYVMIIKRDHNANAWIRAGMLQIFFENALESRTRLYEAMTEPSWFDIE